MTDFELHSACRCHPGVVRDYNEDACLDHYGQGLWVVADGMGGHEAGDYASQLVIETLMGQRRTERLSEYVDVIERYLLDVNDRLLQKGRELGGRTVGSTVVVFLEHGRKMACLWAGDSRAYRYTGGQLQRVSRDHSHVEELVQRGEIRAEDAESHPEANIITRAIGADPGLIIDVELCDIVVGDRFLLCSDGLTKELTDTEIEAELGSPVSADEVSDNLLRECLDRGARDNVSIIVIDADPIGDL